MAIQEVVQYLIVDLVAKLFERSNSVTGRDKLFIKININILERIRYPSTYYMYKQLLIEVLTENKLKVSG